MTTLGRRLGRRGAMLLTLGLTYIALGYGALTRPPIWAEGAALTSALAAGWVVSGLLACLAAVLCRRRWDTVGWPALYVMPALYILAYGGSWLLWIITVYLVPREPPYGDPHAWYGAALRVPFIAIALICSGWRETPRQVAP